MAYVEVRGVEVETDVKKEHAVNKRVDNHKPNAWRQLTEPNSYGYDDEAVYDQRASEKVPRHFVVVQWVNDGLIGFLKVAEEIFSEKFEMS